MLEGFSNQITCKMNSNWDFFVLNFDVTNILGKLFMSSIPVFDVVAFYLPIQLLGYEHTKRAFFMQ